VTKNKDFFPKTSSILIKLQENTIHASDKVPDAKLRKYVFLQRFLIKKIYAFLCPPPKLVCNHYLLQNVVPRLNLQVE